DRVTRLVEGLAHARADVPSPAVDRETARRARSLHDTLTELLGQHDATSPVLHVESLTAAVAVQRDDGSDQEGVSASDEARVVLTHDTLVELPGQARLRIELRDDSRTRVARILELREQLTDVLARCGVTDVDELERSADATTVARQAVLQLTRDLQAALAHHG